MDILTSTLVELLAWDKKRHIFDVSRSNRLEVETSSHFIIKGLVQCWALPILQECAMLIDSVLDDRPDQF